MRIERFNIDGFGIFRDFHQDGLETGTPIFLGANEAGKSTLMVFLQRMLFGWKDKKSNPYEPLCGGNWGGELTLLGIDGKKTHIVRSWAGPKSVSVTLADGRSGTEADLAQLFGRVNEQVYRSVYAFGLSELQSMVALDQAGIRERIYSAGAGLGDVSLQEVRNVFQREAKALFLPSGSKPEINTLLSQIKEIDQSLKGVTQRMATYDRLREELQESDSTLVQRLKDREDTAAELRSVESLLLAWGDWVDRQEACRELENTSLLERFPEDGLTRLENLLAALDELRINRDELAESIEKRRKQADTIALDTLLLGAREKIAMLEKESEKYRSAREDSQKKEALRAELAEELGRTLQEISPIWQEEDLECFDVSIAAREQRQSAAEDLRQAEQDLARQEDLLKGFASRLAETTEAFKEAKQNDQVQNQAINGQEDNLVLERKQALHRIRAGKTKQAELESRLETNQRALAQGHTSRAPLWPAFAFFFFAIVMGVLFLTVYPLPWLAAVGFIALSASGGLYLFNLRSRRLLKDGGPAGGDLAKQVQVLVGELHGVQAQIAADARQCGLAKIPDAYQLEEGLQTAEALLRQLQQANQTREALAKLQQKMDKEEAEKRGQEEKQGQAKEALRLKQVSWQTLLHSLHLETTLSPEGALAAFAKIEIAREKRRSIQQLDADLVRMAGAVSIFQKELGKTLDTCGRAGLTGDPVELLTSLTRELSLEGSKEREWDDLRVSIEKDLPKMDVLKKKLASREGELNDLLLLGSATDLEQFRRNQAIWIQRRKLEDTIRQAEKNLHKIWGEGEEYAGFLSALAAVSPQDLQGSKERLVETQRLLDGEIQTMAEKKGGLSKSIQQLEGTDEGEKLRVNRMERIDRIAHAAKRWAVLTLADTFLGKAMRKFELERQPEVLKIAQHYFNSLTGGRYTGIVRPMDEERLHVLDRDGKRKALEELSTGTAEQLYLALRFGFIGEFERGNEPLPIILDDIFVNFDPDRFEAACGAVQKLAETHQVLTFTCHPQIAEKMAKAVPYGRVIQLPAVA